MDVSLPKYIRYDFLMTLIGLVLFAFSIYYAYINYIQKLENITGLSFILSIGLLSYGLGQMYNNYSLESELFSLESFVRRKDAIKELKKRKVIDAMDEDVLTYFLIREVKELIDKKREKHEQKGGVS